MVFNPPLIGYNNVLRDGIVTASAINHELSYDWRIDRAWALPSGAHFIEVQLPFAVDVNYLGLFAHNIGVINGQLQVEYWDGATFIAASTPIVPISNECVFDLFTTVNSDRFRIVIDAPADGLIGSLAIGKALALDSGLLSGFIPPLFSNQAAVINTTSEKGLLLGRSIRTQAGSLTINANLHDEQWMRSEWLPFKAHALRFPFFFIWNEAEFPLEAAFCWTPSTPNANSYAQAGFMSGALSVLALTELVT